MRGDLLLQTYVEIPKKVNARQEDLLRQLAEVDEEHVTPQRKSFLDRILVYFRHNDDEKSNSPAE
jgi:molecular chaperone DnaJ